MKKPVHRALRLEEALADLQDAEHILSQVETSDALQGFTHRQKRHFYEVLADLRDLIHDLEQEAAQEQVAS